jgi:hypothetical protein
MRFRWCWIGPAVLACVLSGCSGSPAPETVQKLDDEQYSLKMKRSREARAERAAANKLGLKARLKGTRKSRD